METNEEFEERISREQEEYFIDQQKERDAAFATLVKTEPVELRYGPILTWCSACGWEWYGWIRGYERPYSFIGVVQLWEIPFNMYRYDDTCVEMDQSLVLQHRDKLEGKAKLHLLCSCDACGPFDDEINEFLESERKRVNKR